MGFRKAHSHVCAEEERIKVSQGGSVNYLKDKKKNYNNSSSSKSPGKGPMQQSQNKQFPVDKDQCLHCKGRGHYKQNCPDFLKMIMKKKGENIITFVNESLYVKFSKSTWWIDSGATIYVANSLQGISVR